MSNGRSRLYDDGKVAVQQDLAAAAVSTRTSAPRTIREARNKIDTLCSINAQLVRQVALLKQREAQVQRLADRDGLTGLYNRRKMLELLESSITDATQHKQ